jgi:hypothetical protein
MVVFKYNCTKCVYSTNIKQVYNIHLQSKRHIAQIESEQFIFACEKCNKKFKCNSGKWRHSLKCVKEPTPIEPEEIKEHMKTITDMLVDIKANQHPTTTNNIIQNNQNFNVNLYLNENFTQAKNFIDMINGIQLDTEYHEYISSADYVNSIVRLIKNEIDKLPIMERPIHCIKNEDENQQILHIRHNNQWNKETELEWTQQIHNYYIDDEDEPPDENKKIIFYAIKQMEDNIIDQIQTLYQHSGKLTATKREYKCEMDYVPNKMRIIKTLIEHVNMDRNELRELIEEAYKKMKFEPEEIELHINN